MVDSIMGNVLSDVIFACIAAVVKIVLRLVRKPD